MDETTLLRLAWSRAGGLSFQVSNIILVVVALVAVGLAAALIRRGASWFGKYGVVEVDISLGKVGHVRLQPNTKDAQVAHEIWTELVTRKAAVPIDTDRDVIGEIYDSWYTLFQRVRTLIATIPADLLRRDASTRELVRIATQTLNEGLRPHLTRWHAEFRNWMRQHENELKEKSPQEVQRAYPRYADLIGDMRRVNTELVAYAAALEKIARG
jgi:hypothetical protein